MKRLQKYEVNPQDLVDEIPPGYSLDTLRGIYQMIGLEDEEVDRPPTRDRQGLLKVLRKFFGLPPLDEN